MRDPSQNSTHSYPAAIKVASKKNIPQYPTPHENFYGSSTKARYGHSQVFGCQGTHARPIASVTYSYTLTLILTSVRMSVCTRAAEEKWGAGRRHGRATHARIVALYGRTHDHDRTHEEGEGRGHTLVWHRSREKKFYVDTLLFSLLPHTGCYPLPSSLILPHPEPHPHPRTHTHPRARTRRLHEKPLALHAHIGGTPMAYRMSGDILYRSV